MWKDKKVLTIHVGKVMDFGCILKKYEIIDEFHSQIEIVSKNMDGINCMINGTKCS